MFLGLGLPLGAQAAGTPGIQITAGAYLDSSLLQVGLVLQDAFVSGTYPDFQGNVVNETVTEWLVNSVALTGPDATSYTLQSGDLVGQAEITLTATGAPTKVYFSGITTVTDFSYTPTDLEWVVPPGGAAPDAFTVGQWSVADDGTNGDITITITTLPADNGSAITSMEYRIDAGSWTSLGGTTTGTYGVSGLTDGTSVAVEVRASNVNGGGTASDVKNVTPTGVPAAFTVGMWTLTDLTTGGDARIAISTLPSANGSALTDLEYKKDAGAWTSLAGTTTGNYDLSDVFTDGVSANVLIRAVNANGNGADSDQKSVTTTTASGGITGHDAPQVVINSADPLSSYTGDVTGRASGEDVVIVVANLANSGGAGGTNASWTVTLDGSSLTPLDSESTTLIFPNGAIYRTTPSNTGDLTLSVACGGNPRSLVAIAWRIAGAGSTVAADAIKNEGAVTSVSHPNAVTTGANGNVVLSCVAVKGGDITGLAVTGADGSATGQTDTSATADLTYGYAYQTKDPAGSVTHAWSWTGADAYFAAYIELAKA